MSGLRHHRKMKRWRLNEGSAKQPETTCKKCRAYIAERMPEPKSVTSCRCGMAQEMAHLSSQCPVPTASIMVPRKATLTCIEAISQRIWQGIPVPIAGSSHPERLHPPVSLCRDTKYVPNEGTCQARTRRDIVIGHVAQSSGEWSEVPRAPDIQLRGCRLVPSPGNLFRPC